MTDFPLMQYKPVEKEEVLPDIDAHGYLQGVYRGQIKPNGSRLRAAMAALPFERPKLGAFALVNKEDLAERLANCLAASTKVINSRPVQVIEAPKVDAGEPEQVELPDHSKPFAHDNKSRWRRF